MVMTLAEAKEFLKPSSKEYQKTMLAICKKNRKYVHYQGYVRPGITCTPRKPCSDCLTYAKNYLGPGYLTGSNHEFPGCCGAAIHFGLNTGSAKLHTAKAIIYGKQTGRALMFIAVTNTQDDKGESYVNSFRRQGWKNVVRRRSLRHPTGSKGQQNDIVFMYLTMADVRDS